ncbi:hypothetical protein IC235_07310 [Hymenobacter sp. BT664]|uniref:Uncharacterized protein n=1 Tax=Hymenobacter montanus TaxID=2771359 RepID=A0A927BCZ2_9BACT|nr:hypothetical protein [Hymenobacter montanus]MBD2767698.1 hypothetical protein [Hymenobacter montanus]
MRSCLAPGGLLLTQFLPQPGRAQTSPPPPLYATYQYQAYTVYENASTTPPTKVPGVGGTLVLRPDSTYEKRLRIATPSGPYYFNQTGRFFLAGDSIRFVFTDAKGTDVQRGTFNFNPAKKQLTISINGYPAGNKGVYELIAAGANPTRTQTARPPKPTGRRPPSSRKGRR